MAFEKELANMPIPTTAFDYKVAYHSLQETNNDLGSEVTHLKDELFVTKEQLGIEMVARVEAEKEAKRLAAALRAAKGQLEAMQKAGMQALMHQQTKELESKKQAAAAWRAWLERGGQECLSVDYPLKAGFQEKDAVKALGAQWETRPGHQYLKRWVVRAKVSLEPFARWL